MAMAQKKQGEQTKLGVEGEYEMRKIVQRHGLNDMEADKIREISKKFYVTPERVVATIVLNKFTENTIKYWKEKVSKENDDRYRKMAAIASEMTVSSPSAERRFKKEFGSLVGKLRLEEHEDYYRNKYGR
jgi:AraC-like DNA-binding protein